MKPTKITNKDSLNQQIISVFEKAMLRVAKSNELKGSQKRLKKLKL